MAHGHDPAKIPHYSLDKLRLFHRYAMLRVSKEQSQCDLRMLRVVRIAIGSVMDKKGLSHYKKTEEALVRACEFEPDKPQSQQANLNRIAEKLLKMGATRMYGRKH